MNLNNRITTTNNLLQADFNLLEASAFSSITSNFVNIINDLERKFTATNEMIKLSHWRQIREINGEQFCQVTGINYPMISAFIDLLNHQRVEQFKMVLDSVCPWPQAGNPPAA